MRLKNINSEMIELFNSPFLQVHFSNTNNFGWWLLNQINADYYKPYFDKFFEVYQTGQLVILDAGANAGLFSLYCEPIAKKIIMVDASPNCCSILKDVNRVFLNKKGEVIQAALGPVDGDVTFYYSEENTAMNSTIQIGSHTRSETVKQVSLDTILETNPFIDLFKCDIEGGEGVLFEDFNENHAMKIKSIFCEYHPDSFGVSGQKIIDKLSQWYDVTVNNDVIFAI